MARQKTEIRGYTAPLTYQEALIADEFHYTGAHQCSRIVGPRGGVTERIMRVRRNGQTQTWKTKPTAYRIPVKYGRRARDQFSIWHTDAHLYHPAERCALLGETA